MDGEIVKGTSAVDESPITGESLPRAKGVGDQVYAGTINQRGALEVRVTARAVDSTLARLIKMVEEAQGQKAPSQRWVDSFAKYYTPVVMAVALVTAVGPPLLLGASWSAWIYRALALLILACPCALVISTPVSIVSAIGAASKHGVLIKGGAHLEAAGNLRVVAFDKTGTLTEGFPRVTEVLTFAGAARLGGGVDGEAGRRGEGAAPGDDDLVLSLAASVERDSEHPLADAIMHAAKARGLMVSPVADFEALPGRGAQARLGDRVYLVGNPQLFADLGVPVSAAEAAQIETRQRRGETVILLGTHEGALGAISIADEVRPQSRDVVKQLHDAGIEQVLMLTGDNRQTADAVAATLGLDGYRAELMPDQKVDVVRELLAEYGGVAMVGDGINDAPALATATVGIAMGAAGTDTAIETADIALMTDDLSKVPFTIGLSRATRHTVWQNIIFALALKVVASLLVFPGWLALWMAVLTDTGGSLIVIANGLRLLRYGRDDVGAANGPASIGLPPRKRLTPVAVAGSCSTSGCSCSVGDHDPGHPAHDHDDTHEGHDHGEHHHEDSELEPVPVAAAH
jgi:Cd2+/Zn2+-exporting ATPase